MLGYATSTGTRRNLAGLRAAGWGLLLTPDRPEARGFDRILIDNGAWGCFQRKEPWDAGRFVRLLALHPTAQIVVAPDIVCGGDSSLALSLSWLDRLAQPGRIVLIPVQDGMCATDLASHVGAQVGLFVGGSTAWKESSLPMWGALAQAAGCYLHVGRVNSARRIRLCAMAGADSFDGTSASRFAVTLPPLDFAARQSAFLFVEESCAF